MVHINDHYLKLKAGYLFPEIARRVDAFAAAHPQADVIRLGIGDVVKGIPRPMVDAMKEAVEEMAHDDTLQGYPPDQGQDFLREAIVEYDFGARGVQVHSDEIFVSDGSKCDSGAVQEIFADDCVVALTDPVYPVYCDSNVMAGRTGPADENGSYAGMVYMPCTAANDFIPDLPTGHVDLIYLCSPNNPTGAVMTRDALARWIEYARREQAVILFDAAYESYITDPALPRSIYEVEGAREVAIEFRSFSKNAGFTGLRCGYIVVPKELKGRAASGEEVDLHRLWARRHSTKFNGVAYPVQRAAAAAYSSGRPAGHCRARCVLHGKCRDYAPAVGGGWAYCVRGRARSLFVGDHARWAGQLDLLRLLARQGPHRRHAGCGFWRGWRRILASVGLQSPRPDRRGHGAD